MTRKLRKSSPSPELSAASSARSKFAYRRKIPRENAYKNDHYTDASLSQSPSESNEDEDGYEKSVNEEEEEDDDALYMGSVSETNARSDDQFSSQEPDEQVPINFNATGSLNLASNSQPSTRFASYMNIAPLPIFHGGPSECPVTHLSRFNKVCRANNLSTIDTMMRVFPVTLEEEAALWYDLNIEPYPSLTWEEIKSSFLHAYHKLEVVEQLRSELMVINQGDEESVRSYFLRLQWILKQWPNHGLSDGLLRGVFIDGLREEFQEWIIPQKPDSLSEALRLAFGFEQVKGIRAVGKKVFMCGFCDGMHEERGCEVREKMRELWRKSKEKQEIAKSGSSDHEVGKELVMRSAAAASIGESSSGGVGKIEGEDGKEEGGLLLGGNCKKSQCQCWKHQCWKKKLERNNSAL